MDFLETKNIIEDIFVPHKEQDIILLDTLQIGKEDTIISVNDELDITFRPSTSDENIFNEQRIRVLEREFTSKLELYITEENFEYGYENKADVLLKEQMSINKMATKEWLSNIYIKNYANIEIMIGLLRLISRFDINEIAPQGQLMATTAILHKNMEVKECGIRAFESWASWQSLPLLENMEVGQGWLKDYQNSVIKYIKDEHEICR